jgi:predicted nuclease of predicted toxin-antitoxin system
MADLEFIANMNISPLTVNELKRLGWDIVRVSEILEVQTRDIELLSFAREHNKVLITQDLDFSVLLAIGGYEKPSVINTGLR